MLVGLIFLLACASTKESARTRRLERLHELQLIIKMEPTQVEPYLELAQVYLEMYRHPEALDALNTALDHHPGHSQLLLQKGVVYYRQKNWQKASEFFKSVLLSDADPQHVDKIAHIVGMPFHIRQKTDGIGENAFPSCSRDGRTLLFQSNRNGNWDIYYLNAATGALQQLTTHPARDEDPVLLPDGETFLFSTSRDDSVHVHVENLTRNLYRGRIGSVAIEPVIQDSSDNWAAQPNPQGSTFLFLSDRHADASLPHGQRQAQIFEYNWPDGSLRQLSHAAANHALGDFSTRAGKIYFAADIDKTYHIYSRDKKGRIEKIDCGIDANLLGPQISRDGSKMVFFAGDDQNYDIYMYDFAEKKAQQLTRWPAFQGYPVFSHDDQRVVFHSNHDRTFQIYEIDLTVKIRKEDLLTVVNKLGDRDSG